MCLQVLFQIQPANMETSFGARLSVRKVFILRKPSKHQLIVVVAVVVAAAALVVSVVMFLNVVAAAVAVGCG